VAPAQIAATLDAVLVAVQGGGADGIAAQIAASLKSGKNVALLIGNLAVQTVDAAQIHARVQAVADALKAANGEAQVRFGFLGEAANSVGCQLVGALPGVSGMHAGAMMASPRKAYLVVHAEVALDTAYGAQAVKALQAADMSVVLTSFRQSLDCADVLLPVAPFTETAGTFVNTEGRAQSFNGVVKPLGDTRPAWKVLRVLGNLLGLPGFEYDTAEAVRAACLPGDIAAKLGNRTSVVPSGGAGKATTSAGSGFERIADLPIYFADLLARRAASLQLTADARLPQAALTGADLARLGVADNGSLRVRNGAGELLITAIRDDKLPPGCIRISGGHASTINAGPLSGVVSVERA
jgi:NADH-quinone oxidoreductase subunit G